MDVLELKQKASGRYIEIVGHFIPDLIEPMQKPTRGIPCPCHGKKDGFNFGNKFNDAGRGFCQLTGSKDIFEILEMWLGWSLIESYIKLTKYLGGESPSVSSDHGYKIKPIDWNKKKNQLARYYFQTIPDNGTIKKYLHSRGIDVPVPRSLRLHPNFKYFDWNQSGDYVELGCYPAMIAKVWLGSGMAGLHVTYLAKDGSGKADIPAQRKMHSCSPLFGQAHISLLPFNSWPGTTLLVGEGIETCLSAYELTKKPVWCAMSARGLENIKIPESILKVQILADNDSSGAGLLVAENLQARLEKDGKIVNIAIPDNIGDWNDYLLSWKENRKT